MATPATVAWLLSSGAGLVGVAWAVSRGKRAYRWARGTWERLRGGGAQRKYFLQWFNVWDSDIICFLNLFTEDIEKAEKAEAAPVAPSAPPAEK